MIQIVAEVGANHLGSLERALRLIDAAKHAGADMVKFQCWRSGSMCLDRDYLIPDGPWKGESLAELYDECETPWHWFPTLFAYARSAGIEPFASAFDVESVELLESLGVKRHKVASFEITDCDLIAAMAATKKPVIISTGMASTAEISDAVVAAIPSHTTLLHCVSGYPVNPAHYNLRQINKLEAHCDVGLSDHSMGSLVAVAAATLGVTMIEKHLTLARSDGGPDSAFSTEPEEFAAMVRDVRAVEAAMSDDFHPASMTHLPLRRSLYWTRTLSAGDIISDSDIRTARPASGAHPSLREWFIGQKLTQDVKSGTPAKAAQIGL